MSTDAHVSSARLRSPAALSSQTAAYSQRRHLLRSGAIAFSTSFSSNSHGGHDVTRFLLADSAAGSLGFLDRDSNEHQQQQALQQHQQQHEVVAWLDIDRFEDWDKPTLGALCPDVRIHSEELLFPIAVAEDGETLPSELHPSHPYGDLHQPKTAPYASRKKCSTCSLPVIASCDTGREVSSSDQMLQIRAEGRHLDADVNYAPSFVAESGGEPSDECFVRHSIGVEGESKNPVAPQRNNSLQSPSHQSTRSNPPPWPFKRVGPGPGGTNSLFRHELRRPWRPYQAVWSDIDMPSSSIFSSSKRHTSDECIEDIR